MRQEEVNMAVERLNFLRRQGVSEGLLRGVEDFCRAYEGQKTETDRVQLSLIHI